MQRPSEICKAHGLTLKRVSQLTGVSTRTLINWSRNRPELFEIIVRGCSNSFDSSMAY